MFSIRSSRPYSHGLDVYGIGAGKQRRKIEKLIGRLVGGVKPSVWTTPNRNFPRVSDVEVSAASNATAVTSGGIS